jgi:hypothetical protein
MIASLGVAVLTNTWPFFMFRDLWPSGRFFSLVIFLLMSFGILVPVLVAGVFAPDHVVIFIEWWEIALFAVFWGLETRRVARLRANTVKKRHPDRGPLKEPHRIMVGEQPIKGRVSEKTEALDAEQEPRRAQQERPVDHSRSCGRKRSSCSEAGSESSRCARGGCNSANRWHIAAKVPTAKVSV